jgi:hypothetical protein
MEPVAQQFPAADRPLQGTLHAFVAFDWGDEIDLEQAARLTAAESHVLRRRTRTPSSIAYRPNPLRLALPAVRLTLAELGPVEAAADVTIFDFAAVSVGLHVRFEVGSASLARLAATLAEPTLITDAARRAIEPVWGKLQSAILDPEWSETSEEYFVFELPPGNPLPLPTELLAAHAAWLAGLVRLESAPLHNDEIAEALRLRISYSPSDLFIAEWSAALLIDEPESETLDAIEFANLQLLEFRYTDNQLDDRLAHAYRLIHPLARSSLPFWRAPTRQLRALGDLRIEANAVFERTSNVLKLVGDQYLARVYRLLVARFHLDDWEQSIRRSLDVVEGVYRVVADQTATSRAEFLEVMIVILILLEIAMAWFRG